MKSSQFSAMAMALLFATAAFGQTDTVFTTLSQENGTLAPQQFMSEYDRAFGAMTPAKWMFKVDLAHTLSHVLENPGIHTSVETKLSKAVSIDANFLYAPPAYIGDQSQNIPKSQVRLGTTLRWYYDMKKRIAAGKSASNFSGNYIGLESAVLQETESNYVRQGVEFVAKFGLQRRLLRFGYFDLSFGLGAKYNPAITNFRKTWTLTSQPRVAMGLALFSPRKNNTPSGTTCEVLKCFQESHRMFKIDLYNLMQINNISTRLSYYSLNPSIALEQKIGDTPLSVELGAAGSGGILKISNSTFGTSSRVKSKNISGTGVAELRWYFLQKQHILQGKSGNNLSGLFLGLNAAHTIGKGYFFYSGKNLDANFNNTSVRGILGLQHRILNHGFVQFKVGAGPQWGKGFQIFNGEGVEYLKLDPKFDFYTEFKAGLAF